MGLRIGIVRQDLARTGGGRVQPAVRPKRLAIGVFGVGDEEAHVAVQPDLVSLAVGNVVEKDLALGIGGGPFGESIAFGDQAPAFAGDQDLLELLGAEPRLHGRGPVFPEPAHRVGKDLGRVVAAVPAGSPFVVDFVAGERERAFHFLIGHPPIAAVDVQVGAAVLEKDADRLGLELADQGRIDVAAAQADISADRAENTPERIRAAPTRP